ncbi:uncharacterized protein LOC124123188 [Haliotis rufescens]|uniref:uncharacterized protein LOC124123188 n=1 Tax=Haliotis rufescens TaxID=6454 RepID=UPI00201F9249|nr:uncharacterized protein LOC124123188 [Haliotis rufescens]XP_048251674.1 uncharacterized protein LOC124123188 [Haliotis rufescens]
MSFEGSDASSFSRTSSFSDQEFKAFDCVALDSTCASLDTRTPTEVHLSHISISSFFPKKKYDAGEFVIYPKCMHTMLSSEYPKMLSVLEETYRLGAFIYVGSSFQCLFLGNQQQFHTIKTKLICDMCIFPKDKSVIMLTVAKDKTLKTHLSNYNLQMKKNLEEWISETEAEFKALSGVVVPQDFQIRGKFECQIADAEQLAKRKGPPPLLAKHRLYIEAFLQKLATCKFVHRFYAVPGETVYLIEDTFEDFIELMEETGAKTVYLKCSECTMLLVCELAYRLALLGHTALQSNTEVKKELEELRCAQNISISITYGTNVADENVQEGDVLLSSWKGGTILFRTELTEVVAARRALASAVVRHSLYMKDEERCERLVDLVCLNIEITEERLKTFLQPFDFESQIVALESLNTSLQVKKKNVRVNNQLAHPMCPPRVVVDEEHRSLALKMKTSFDDRNVQQNRDTQSTCTSEGRNGGKFGKRKEGHIQQYPAENLNHMGTSHYTDQDNRDVPHAQQSRQMYDSDTFCHTIIDKDSENNSQITYEDSQMPIRDPTFSKATRLTASESYTTRQRDQYRNVVTCQDEQIPSCANNSHSDNQDASRVITDEHISQHERKASYQDQQWHPRQPVFPLQSRDSANYSETTKQYSRPSKGRSSPQFTTSAKADSHLKKHDGHLPKNERPFLQTKIPILYPHAFQHGRYNSIQSRPRSAPEQDLSLHRGNPLDYSHNIPQDRTRHITEQNSTNAKSDSQIKHTDRHLSRKVITTRPNSYA